MFKVANAAEFDQGLDGWLAACALLADDALRGLAWSALVHAAEQTPQWSGNMAANWHITVGAPVTGEITTKFKLDHWQDLILGGASKKGDPAAIEESKALARGDLPPIHLGVDVYLSNPTPYAAEVNAGGGTVKLRQVNLPVESVYQMATTGIPGYGPELSEALIRARAKGTS